MEESEAVKAEELLAGYHAGTVDFEALIQGLVNEKVSILLDEVVEVDAEGMMPPLAPLTLNDREGKTYVAVCTSGPTAAEVIKQAPDYKYALQVPFGWVLQSTKRGYGILFNPGSKTCLDLVPDTTDQLRDLLQSR